jgi:hypothetical protein
MRAVRVANRRLASLRADVITSSPTGRGASALPGRVAAAAAEPYGMVDEDPGDRMMGHVQGAPQRID